MAEMGDRRDSFDRFGDDLCTDILSELRLDEMLCAMPLKECLRYEWVSKGWKRCLFAAQRELKITLISGEDIAYNDYQTSMRSLLRKCRFVTHVTVMSFSGDNVYINSDIMEVMSENVPHLDSITFDINVGGISLNSWQLFSLLCGPNLRRIILTAIPDTSVDKEWMQTLFRLTPNLMECRGIDLSYAILDHNDGQYLTNLRIISAYFRVNYNYSNTFKLFADQYSTRLTEIALKLTSVNNFMNISCIFNQLPHFKDLEVLSLYSDCNSFEISNGFNMIAMNCKKLRKLCLFCFKLDTNSFRLGFSGHLDSLERLTINGDLIVDDFEWLSCFPNLVYFNIKSDNLSDKHFVDIHLYAPKLREFVLCCMQNISNFALKYLTCLEELISIKIGTPNSKITESDLYLNFLCKNLSEIPHENLNIRKIDLPLTNKIFEVTVEAFISRAKCDPNHKYFLKTHENSSLLSRELPINVKIYADVCDEKDFEDNYVNDLLEDLYNDSDDNDILEDIGD